MSHLVDPSTLHGERDRGSDDARELDLLVVELCGVVVEHELADHATETDQGNESHGSDAFARKDRQVFLERRFARHGDEVSGSRSGVQGMPLHRGR